MADTVALIGMGLLGSALAENLLAAGFTVRGYDVAPDRLRQRSEERRVGKECGLLCRSRWSPYH